MKLDVSSIKKVAVLGAGESGNGAAILAHVKGYDVFVSDYGIIKEQYKSELQQYQIDFEEGGHNIEKILDSDVVIKSPGIPDTAPIIIAVRQKGISVISEIEWAYQFKAPEHHIIAITGSNGKSTTTKLLYHILSQAGYDTAMVGNIGVSIAKQIAIEPKSYYVTEVSSFQLDDIIDFKPHVAIILNITPDHLDRYNHDMHLYAKAKYRITENQDQNDILIINQDDSIIEQLIKQQPTKARIITFTMNNIDNNNNDGAFMNNDEMSINYQDQFLGLPIQEVAIKGKHNLYNSMAAGISAMALGIRNSALRESFSSFEGLEHRLEHVATVKGVDYINDSKATNLNSVWYALESMTQPVILILGGKDKGNDYNEIMDVVKDKVKAIVCMGADNTPILNAFNGVVGEMYDTHSAEDAVQTAYSIAQKGDAVLLSPGCASFDLFKNYEERGEKFKEAVKNL